LGDHRVAVLGAADDTLLKIDTLAVVLVADGGPCS
jgi:hypothetical protein